MNYKIKKNTNIFINNHDSIKTDVKEIYNYNNEDLKINTKGLSYISQYSGIKKVKKKDIYILLNDREIKILQNNESKKNKIISLENCLDIRAEMINYFIENKYNKNYIRLEIEIYEGILIPQGNYQISFEKDKIPFQMHLFEDKEYYQDYGYTYYQFSLENIKSIYISFNIGLIQKDKKNNALLNNNGNIYLFDNSTINIKNIDNIKNSINQNKYIQEFQITEINKLHKKECYLIPNVKEYILIQINNMNKFNIDTYSLINNIQIFQINKNHIIYKLVSKDTIIEKFKSKLNIFSYIMFGILLGKYYYYFKTKKNIINLKKKYNKLENSYKYLIENLQS